MLDKDARSPHDFRARLGLDPCRLTCSTPVAWANRLAFGELHPGSGGMGPRTPLTCHISLLLWGLLTVPCTLRP